MSQNVDLGKVAITLGGIWDNATNYERLDYVLYEEDGCGYIALQTNIGVTPGTDSSVWKKATMAGKSIYELCVQHGTFVGTEAEFVAQYNEAVAAATSAASSANSAAAAARTVIDAMNTLITSVQNAEASREAAETARVNAETSRAAAETQRESDFAASKAAVDTAAENATNVTTAAQTAEAARAAAETARVNAEAARVTAENGRVSAEASRVSAEAARVTEFAGMSDAIAAKASIADLVNGVIIPALAKNLSSWESRSALSVESSFSDAVRTTAGEESIDSSKAAKIVSIAAKTNFAASAFRSSGFNLLHNATAVGSGYYFIVPALPFGTFGTATEPNGLLFTDSDGNNLQPTVRFKKLSEGVPTSVSDGSACAYTDSNNYRFYNPTEAGYIIVSGITFANTCAHIAWSMRYDEFISPTDSDDAGSVVSLTSIIAAVHSYGLLLAVGAVSDRIDFGTSVATWHRKCDRIAPTWVNTQNEDGSYTHSATISAMKAGGAASCDSATLTVEDNVVSYTDNNADATTDYVYYELATEVTGNVSIAPNVDVEDWGVEYLVGASGSAYITMQYAQGYPDSVAALVAGGLLQSMEVIAQTLNSIDKRIAAIEDKIQNGFGKIIVEDLEVRHAVDDYSTEGNGNLSGAGAPAVIPARRGQRYFDTTNSVWYTATGNSAVSNWKQDSNA